MARRKIETEPRVQLGSLHKGDRFRGPESDWGPDLAGYGWRGRVEQVSGGSVTVTLVRKVRDRTDDDEGARSTWVDGKPERTQIAPGTIVVLLERASNDDAGVEGPATA